MSEYTSHSINAALDELAFKAGIDEHTTFLSNAIAQHLSQLREIEKFLDREGWNTERYSALELVEIIVGELNEKGAWLDDIRSSV